MAPAATAYDLAQARQHEDQIKVKRVPRNKVLEPSA